MFAKRGNQTNLKRVEGATMMLMPPVATGSSHPSSSSSCSKPPATPKVHVDDPKTPEKPAGPLKSPSPQPVGEQSSRAIPEEPAWKVVSTFDAAPDCDLPDSSDDDEDRDVLAQMAE